MPDPRSLLERESRRFEQSDGAFERLLRRRDRKRRNRRIRAGVVGLAIGLGAILAGASIIRSSGTSPAEPTPTKNLPQLRRDGEVVEGGFSYEVFGGVERPVGLFAIDPETGERRTLADCSDPCKGIADPAWSPDGTRIAYFLDACTGPNECGPQNGIWVMDAFGQVQLTQCPNSPYMLGGGDVSGACVGHFWGLPLFEWLPDSTRIAFLSASPSETKLKSVDVEGGHQTVLLSPYADLPVWSPDGTLFAYVEDGQLFVMPTEGGDPILVAGTGAIGPTGSSDIVYGGFQITGVSGWSPDGTSILFSSNEGIGVVNADGSDLQVLANGSNAASNAAGRAAWSSDGTKIAWLAPDSEAGSQVWLMSADGSNQTMIFEGDCCIVDGEGPIWSPDGTLVAFKIYEEPWRAVPVDGSTPATTIDPLIVEAWRQAP